MFFHDCRNGLEKIFHMYSYETIFASTFLKNSVARLFYKQHIFSTQPQCCLLLRCCLILLSITILKRFLYLLYLHSCLDVGLCDLFFIFIFIFIMINRINTDALVLLLIFQNMPYYYFWITTWLKKVNNFQMANVQPQGVAQHLYNFFAANFSLALVIKVLLIKKRVYQINWKT